MGGCASKPRDLDTTEPKPVEAPSVEKLEAEPVAQENNGGEETKTEEPLVDLSETTEEATETSESKPAEEPTEVAETKAEEKIEAVVEAEAAPAKAEANAEAAPAEAEAKAEASPAEVDVASETEKTPKPVEEPKAVEAQTSEDKSDAPLVTM
ncbi:hypothetical protein BVRB_3g050640 [Beta vulgaris subsp. vulgaris]|uniref:Uncharacterized protein n=1 Tax=Beta vulgaris subsp. vulgaris TaxID=3555 RepID=A0A0J8FKK0_BETVV|nr:uncharacterized protein LOC104888116 [Beta vulgaris subsp. vulgaris]KMT16441.1 hypothetical protein BVRB_3g050640 [Beta vulgaris subsp. vulgaris]